MTAKITLYSEDELIAEVKNFAKEKNTSVSKLVNGFFKSLISESKVNVHPKITSSLLGVMKEDTLDKSDYKKYLADKYQ